MNDNIIDAANSLLKKSPFIQFMGVEILELSETYVKGRMPFKTEYENPYKTMHGGCLYALADTIAGTLANMSGKLVTTVEGSLNFLEPACNTEYVYCEATLIRTGRTLATVNAEIKDDNGKLLDCGYFTYYKTNMDILPQ